jgi:uncharacterized protein (TIGR03437 family)
MKLIYRSKGAHLNATEPAKLARSVYCIGLVAVAIARAQTTEIVLRNFVTPPHGTIATAQQATLGGNGGVQTEQPTGTNRKVPSISISSVANGATNLVGPVAPGEIVVLYGSSLGPTALVQSHVNNAGLVDTQLAGTQAFFNGTPAPIIYTWATQVAAIVPYELSGSASAQVKVTFQGQTSASMTVRVAESAPGLFTLDSAGKGTAAAVNEDGSINSMTHQAAIGDIITLFATGEGQTVPAGVDGKLANTPLPHPVLPVTVTIGGQTVKPLYAGGAPGAVAGMMQINVQIPNGISWIGSTYDVPIVLQVGNTVSQAGVTITVNPWDY